MKKYEGVKGLAFVSLIAALCWILVLITYYTSGIGLIILLVLPLCASLVTLFTEKKYVLVYAVATSLMSLITPDLGIFIVIPSIISGVISGILMKKYIHGYYIIFLNALVLTFLQAISTYLINLIFEVNMIELFGTLLKLKDVGFKDMFYLFIYIMSLIQASLSYLISTNELSKFHYEFNEKKNQFLPILVITSTLIILPLGISFISKAIAYLLVGFSYYFAVVLGYYLFSFYQRKQMLKVQLPSYGIALILIIALLFILPKEYRFLSLLSLPLSELVGSSYILIYQLGYKKIGIHESLFDID